MPQYRFKIAHNIEIEECNEILRLVHQSFSDDSQKIYSLKMFIDFGQVFLCYDTQKLVSVIQAMRDWHSNDAIQIISVSTDPQYFGKGAASFIVENMINFCLSNNFRKIGVRIPPDSNSMLKIFSEKFGFAMVSKLENYYGEGEHRFYYERELP